MIPIKTPVKDLCIRAALSPQCKIIKKERLMHLYEAGVLSPCEVINLIKQEGLKHA